MTNIALATMLKASPPLGYECRYFDRTTRDLRGGILQQSLVGIGFADDARQSRERALVAQGLVHIDQEDHTCRVYRRRPTNPCP